MVASKGLTSAFPLKMRPEERELVETVRAVYKGHGVEMSLNDTLRHLVRRAAIVLKHTPAEAEAAIREHCAECDQCDEESKKVRCPEGLYLVRNLKQVVKAHHRNTPAHAR